MSKVFLSYSLADRDIGEQLGDALTRAGFDVVGAHRIATGEPLEKALRSDLRTSSAVVAVVGPSPSSNVLFELGAAYGAGKPVLVVATGPDVKVPSYLERKLLVTLSQVDDLISELQHISPVAA